MTALKLTLLGRPQISLDDQPISELNSSKAQALLFYLAVTRQRHSRQELAGLLWPDKTEARARNNLRVEITRVRPFLGKYLDIQRPSLRMRSLSGLDCDVTTFLELVEAPQPTLRQLQTAVDLYRGDFLEDFNLPDAILFEEWAQERRAYLREQALDALYQIAEYHSQQKNYRSGIETARRLLDLEPWLEKAHRQLMWMLAKSGDRAAALVQYESCYELLDEELGVEPEEETIELYEQIKAGEIAPDADYNQAEAVIAPPFQVPKLTENFVGRHRDMAWLLDKLTSTSDDEPVAVVGMGGMGKTTLAIAVCHELRDEFEDGVLWANVASGDPAAILEDWAQAFGYDFSRLPDVESRAGAFRGVLAEKKVLIVLDDVVSLARVRPLLPHTSSVKVLITTRDVAFAYNLDAQIRELAQLSPDQASQLLTQIVGSERMEEEPEAAQTICDLLQNLPLAVEIVAQRLRLFRSMTLAEMVDRLRNEQQRLAELELRDQAVQASFAISYRALDSYEKRAFALMGVFNGRSFPRQAFAAIAELDYFTAGDRLFSLEGASLVQVGEDSRFQQHSLLADFALEKLAEDGEREAGYGRFIQHYLHFAQQNRHNYDTLRPEWENMMTALEVTHDSESWQYVIEFANALRDAWFVRARYSEARAAYQKVYKASLAIENQERLLHCLIDWALICIEQYDLQKSRDLLKEALEISRELNDESKIGDIYLHLSRISVENNEYNEAEWYLSSSEIIKRRLQDKIGLGTILFRRARSCVRQGNYDQALSLCSEALQLQEAVQDFHGILKTKNLLTHIYIEIKEYQLAKPNCEEAVQLAKHLGRKEDYAIGLDKLAIIYRRLGEFLIAQDLAEQSYVVFTQIGGRKHQGLALYTISIIKEDLRQYEQALEIGRKSLRLLEEVSDDFNIALVCIHLGDIYLHLHQEKQSRAYWQRAALIYDSIGNYGYVEDIQIRMAKLRVQ